MFGAVLIGKEMRERSFLEVLNTGANTFFQVSNIGAKTFSKVEKMGAGTYLGL